MEKELIPYEQALDLKELGFDEECLAFYNSTFQTPNELLYPQYGGEVGNWNVENHLISAPLYQQAFRWFREKYGITVFIDYTYLDGMQFGFKWVKLNGDFGEDWNEVLNTYEEAELACLKKLIEIVKTK